MIDADLQRLADRDQPALGALQSAIWRRENEFLASRKMARRLAGWQAGVLALGILGAVGLGMAAAAPQSGPEIMASSDLSPDRLILGDAE